LEAAIERTEDTVVNTNSSTNISGSTTTITTIQSTQTNNFSAAYVDNTDVSTDIFYAMASTVIQDPITNVVYQSQYNGPLTCGFVNLRKVNPTDFLALQRKEDIAGRLITQINGVYPQLDLTPRSEMRDLVIDPVSVEMSNMSVREWFSRCATSISAISQVDNASGNGVSDPFSSSPMKQAIARAYGLNPNDTQILINKQFDILAEAAGVQRGSATSSIVPLTFYTYVKPTVNVIISVGAILATQPDSQTPSLNFQTTNSASISASSAASFYNSATNRWEITTISAQCATSGSISNVGGGTITQTVSNVPAGWGVTNPAAAEFGTDTESNAHLAEVIQARNVTGVDSGTRNGYYVAALGTPGITQSIVVAAGDLYMERDFDSVRQKHVGGCVDIYTRGTSLSEQDSQVLFEYENTGIYGSYANYVALSIVNKNNLQFSIANFASLGLPFYTAVEIIVQQSGSSFYLGTTNATFDNSGGYIFLSQTDMAYTISGLGTVNQKTSPLIISGQPATNAVAVAALVSSSPGSYTIGLFARLQSPLNIVPTIQPIIQVDSVVGNGATGVVPTASINLVRTQDFFLLGGSNQDLAAVSVPSTTSILTTETISMISSSVPIDTAMDLDFNNNGQLLTSKVVTGVTLPAFTVRSSDLSTLYTYGAKADYLIQPNARYQSYSLVIPAPTVVTGASYNVPSSAPYTLTPLLNLATFISDQGVKYANGTSFISVPSSPLQGQYSVSTAGLYTFNAADAGAAITMSYTLGSAIAVGGTPATNVVVSYYKFTLAEQIAFVSGETDVLSSNLPTMLQQTGFVYNVWLPPSYGLTQLVADTGLIQALVPYSSRYIKVTYNNSAVTLVMSEGIDFTLNVNATSGAATITRILTGSIPDGATVSVSYYINETFTVATEYPAYVQILANTIAQSQAACCSVLVKAMIANPVNISMTITLAPTADADTVDSNARSAISLTLANASTTLSQSVLVQQVQNVTGITDIGLPILMLAKSDGAYDIGVVIPTQTVWNPLGADPSFKNITIPQNSFITASVVLPDSTIPGGGQPDAYVGLMLQSGGALNQPQLFRRASSIQDFLSNGGFYIIGTNDQINSTTPLGSSYSQKVLITIPTTVSNPGLQSYLVTYQVYGEGGAKDIDTSPTEYFVPGIITLNYISTTGTTAGGL
jgi:hypothetical protein